MRNYQNQAKIVKDVDSEIGSATRLLMSDVPEKDRAKYSLPMPWGVYDTVGVTYPATGSIQATDIPAAGYHWYKLSDAKLTGTDYIYFFWSSVIQLDIPDLFVSANRDRKFEVWAEIKFEGGMFPHGKTDEADAFSIARVVLFPQ